jgi:hypothetical protein
MLNLYNIYNYYYYYYYYYYYVARLIQSRLCYLGSSGYQ